MGNENNINDHLLIIKIQLQIVNCKQLIQTLSVWGRGKQTKCPFFQKIYHVKMHPCLLCLEQALK